MAALTSLFLRLVHVLGMALLVGGAAFTWYVIRDGTDALHIAVRYEWVFWGALSVMLATGVGNLGSLGPPGPGTEWGHVLTLKLATLLVLTVGSFVRTLVVYELRNREDAPTATLRRVYAATTLVLLVVVAFAEVLAHG